MTTFRRRELSHSVYLCFIQLFSTICRKTDCLRKALFKDLTARLGWIFLYGKLFLGPMALPYSVMLLPGRLQFFWTLFHLADIDKNDLLIAAVARLDSILSELLEFNYWRLKIRQHTAHVKYVCHEWYHFSWHSVIEDVMHFNSLDHSLHMNSHLRNVVYVPDFLSTELRALQKWGHD